MKNRVSNHVLDLFDGLKAHYRGLDNGAANLAYHAARPSKFRRTRTRLGGTADAHYAIETEYWQVREYARDMYRNDLYFQAITDRAVDNIVRCGFMPHPRTGDRVLDEELLDRWHEWSTDPSMCDVAGKMSWYRMERLAMLHRLVDGDLFAILTDSGAVQILEGDRVNSPTNLFDRVVHGVEVDELGRPERYWFVRPRVEDMKINVHRIPQGERDFDKRPAFDGDLRVVLHIFDPSRITQNRGITAYHAVFDKLGMLDDLEFARLVQAQVVSCIAAFIVAGPGETPSDIPFGSRETETRNDATTETFEELAPGIVPRLKAGEDIKGVSSNVPNPEAAKQTRFILRSIGAALGVPIEIALFDTTETNFHGYRGALTQAQMGFECVQKSQQEVLHSPMWRWKVTGWLPELGAAARANRNLFRHTWTPPGWPYVERLKDIQADKLALESMLTSPRRISALRGKNWGEIVDEAADDWRAAILKADEVAKDIEETTEGRVKPTWREVLNLAPPQGQQAPAAPAQDEEREEAKDEDAEMAFAPYVSTTDQIDGIFAYMQDGQEVTNAA